jgi:2'-phosphotransferase
MAYDRVKVSRSLSHILRHGAAREGLPMDAGGFVRLDSLLALRQFRGVSRADVAEIVRSCPKQRFCLQRRAGQDFIRANQGHTIATVRAAELLTPLSIDNVEDFPTVIHGTFRRNLSSILATGLSRMQRQHIHFATQTFTAIGISGLRGMADIVISIDLHAALADGIPFYVSANHVVVTPGQGGSGLLPTRYFAHVYEVLPDHSLRELRGLLPSRA